VGANRAVTPNEGYQNRNRQVRGERRPRPVNCVDVATSNAKCEGKAQVINVAPNTAKWREATKNVESDGRRSAKKEPSTINSVPASEQPWD